MKISLPFLSDDEIRKIAAPLTQPAAIVRWFRNNGFDGLKVRPNGMPLIARAHFDAVTAGAQPTHSEQQAAGEQPDVGAYLKRLAGRAKSMANGRVV